MTFGEVTLILFFFTPLGRLRHWGGGNARRWGEHSALSLTLPMATLLHFRFLETLSENIYFASYCSLLGKHNFSIAGTWNN